jgi:hypothetical protein
MSYSYDTKISRASAVEVENSTFNVSYFDNEYLKNLNLDDLMLNQLPVEKGMQQTLAF